ncbi:MAG: hypothetical protein NT061_12690, partial [Spirochaetes bacterium]|nr:hypothetical protein [Spirochaetota bacterium]
MESRANPFALSGGELAHLLASGPLKSLGSPEARAAVLGNSSLGPCLEAIDEAESSSRGVAIPELPFSLFRLFDETGDRGRYEALYFPHRRRLVAAGLAAWLWGGVEKLSGLEDLLWSICNEYTWALPAHLEGTCLDPVCLGPSRPASADLGTPEKASPWLHSEYLDLFSCETAFALSEILSLVGGDLTPIVASRAKAEVKRRILEPFLARSKPWRWEEMVNNW